MPPGPSRRAPCRRCERTGTAGPRHPSRGGRSRTAARSGFLCREFRIRTNAWPRRLVSSVASGGSLPEAFSTMPRRPRSRRRGYPVSAMGEEDDRISDSGIEIHPVYDRVDGFEPGRDLGSPGEPPFTRGIYPSMYRGRLWTMRQYAGMATARETNQRFRYLLDHGQTGLSVAFDLPTQMGLDSDHPRAEGEVGRTGVAIDSVEDMKRLLDGIPLDRVTTSMTINATAAILLLLYELTAEEQGVPPEKLGGTVQNDILKEYAARGTYIYPPVPSMRLVTDLFAYVRAALDAALQVDEFAPRLSFFFACHMNFFEEAAKFRAARRMWSKIMKERFGAEDPRSAMLRFHTQTGGATLTAQQPENNIVRTALEALAAVLGGTQSLHTNSFDEALALPSEHAAKLALRTQQVIAHETGVTNTIDPLGGSWYLEDLTNRLEQEAYDYFERIEQLGGVVPAIKENFFKREMADASFRYQSEVEAKQRVVVGVNRYVAEKEPPIELLRVDPALEEKQIARVQALRARRDSAAVEAALGRLKQAAAGEENLMPPIIEASRAYVTMGEMCDALREVWGVWRETPVF